MLAARLAVVAAAVGLAGCSYAYKNPAEQLGPGEVGGRTVAGLDVLLDGVAVSVKGAGLDGSSRANGHFAMLPLPVGKHTLTFRKGKERTLQRDVEIAWGKDGQPQGLWMGDVTVPTAVGLSGSCALPAAGLAENGLAVDEVSGAMVPVSAGSGTFAFDGLSVGEHRIRVYATDGQGVPYVGGPAAVTFLGADAGTQKRLSRLALHPASAAVARRSSVTLRFAVAGSVPGLTPGAVTVTGLPAPVTFQSDGTAQVEVPEGLFTVGVVLPPGVSGVTPPPQVSFVAVAGQVVDLGTLYAVSSQAASQAALSCHADADCAPGTCDPTGLCLQWTPPPQAPASVPWCNLDAAGCRAGTPLGGVFDDLTGGYGPPYTMTCAAYDGGTATVGVACGASCTPDGLAVVEGAPGKGGCAGTGGGGGPTAWSSVASGTTAQLSAVWASGPSDAWAVGDLGTILHWDGLAWWPVASGTTGMLIGVWGSGPADVWAVGDGTNILHFDGLAWTSTPTGLPGSLAAVWGSGPSDVWSAGNDGLIVHWDGLAWASVQSPTLYAIQDLWGSGPSDVWAAAARSVLHWDGQAWSSTDSLASGVEAIWGAAAGDVWATGYYGAVQHWDGGGWTLVPNAENGQESSITGVWGASAAEVWAVCDRGTIQRWDGSAWSSVPSGTPFVLWGVGGSAADDVWAVGGVGTILHWSPAPATFSISGSAGGAGAFQVAVTLTGPSTATVTTDSSGAFAFGGLGNGTYTLTPWLAGYTFSPPSIQVAVKGAPVTGPAFTASVVP